MPGERWSHYQVLGKLGAGGMGVVFEAQDVMLGRRVAIKVLPPRLAVDHQAVLRFQREARAASALNHPHICTIHELGEHEGQPFIVMERLDGRTLRHVLRDGPLGTDALLHLASQIADALDAAHVAGIVHRDLKPENIFVTDRGDAKLLDFGLAKLAAGVASANRRGDDEDLATAEDLITEAGRLMGTTAYMSPEQARGEAVDSRTDLFSFGAVLYEMGTGQRASGGTSGAAAMVAGHPAGGQQTQPPVRRTSPLPPQLKAIVDKALESDRDLRYQSAADIKADLGRVKRDLTSGGHQPTAAAAAPARRWWWPSIGAVMLLAIGFGLWASGWVSRSARSTTAQHIRALAVLPLENQSHDPEQQYFADGMTEALLTDLSAIADLRVMSRSSTAQAGQRAAGRLPDIARALNVDAVVEGAVLRVGDRVRVSAQLVDPATGENLWARAYERDLRDVLALQADVAVAIAAEIRGTLELEADKRPAAAARQVDPRAYELYLKGRFFWNQYTEEGWTKALDYFQQAIRIDGRYAPAWAGVADTYYQISSIILPPDQAIPEARAAASRALEIDNTLAEAHASLGVIESRYDWNPTGAERELKRATELNPNYATAHQWLGMLYYSDGRFTEAVASFDRAVELDPLSFYIGITAVWPLPNLGRIDEAIARLERIVEMYPNVPDASSYLHELRGEALLEKGPSDAAIVELLQGSTATFVCDGSETARAALKAAYTRAGMPGYWREQLRLAEQKYKRDVAATRGRARPRYVSMFPLARFHARLGEAEQAFAVLEACVQKRDENLMLLKAESLLRGSPWAAIREDPRFTGLLQRIGLVPREASSATPASPGPSRLP